MATLLHKDPCSRGHEIFNLGRPFIGLHCYALSECELFREVEKIFLRNTSIFHFLPQNYLPLGWGVTVYEIHISCLFTLKMPETKFGQDEPRRF